MTSDTALTPHSPAAVPDVARMTDEEIAEFGDLRVTLPLLKFDGRDGSFTFNLDGSTVTNPKALVLAHKIQNVLFAPVDGPSDGPKWFCRAPDGANGTINTDLLAQDQLALAETGAGATCAACSQIQWSGDSKPACSRTLAVLLVDLDQDVPMVLTAQRTSLKPWEMYLNSFRLRKLRPFSAPTYIEVEEKKDGAKHWFQMAPRRGDMLPAEAIGVYLALKQDLGQYFSERVSDIVSASGNEDATLTAEEFAAAAGPLPF